MSLPHSGPRVQSGRAPVYECAVEPAQWPRWTDAPFEVVAGTLSPDRRPAPRPRPRPIRRRLIRIGRWAYEVRPIEPGPDNVAAVRLVKQAADGAVYDVARTRLGLVECDCPDYEFKRRNTAELCKHGRALVASGLLPSPASAVREEAARA